MKPSSIDGVIKNSLTGGVGQYGTSAQHVNLSCSCPVELTQHHSPPSATNSMILTRPRMTTPCPQAKETIPAESRVYKAISELYDVDISINCPANEAAQQRSVYVSDMLRMAANSLQHRLSNINLHRNQGNEEQGDHDAELTRY